MSTKINCGGSRVSRTDQRASAAEALRRAWNAEARWQGVHRPYSAEEVLRFRGSLTCEHPFAAHTARRFWELLQSAQYIHSLGAMTGNQAVQQVAAGLKSIYVSGWQVAADANLAGQMYPDQSLYPANSVPQLVRAINNALRRADQIAGLTGRGDDVDWYAPIMADAEAGFGGPLNAYELMIAMIEAGAAGVHFEDQLSSAKKCGHMGGKVLVPIQEFIVKLIAARLAADVCDAPTVLCARTDANGAHLLTSDADERDRPFLTGDRTEEGYFVIRGGLDCAIQRALAYAPYADLLWCETAHPDLGEAREFAEAVLKSFPDKMLAYNCSPSFNWNRHLSDAAVAIFQRELGAMGFKYQFVTLAGFHALNLSMFRLALDYRDRGMAAYAALQQEEFALERAQGYAAVKHQQFVGAGFFDELITAITSGHTSVAAMSGSTEQEQFEKSTT
jgi:isocitrate lyase